MSFWKTTFFFETYQQNDGWDPGFAGGWTETWYQDALSIDVALNGPQIDRYLTKRRACLATPYKIQWVRVSAVDNPRLTKIKTAGQQIGQATGLTAQVTCCLLADITALPAGIDTLTHHRHLMLRGLSGNVINGNVVDRSAASWPAIRSFLHYVGVRETGEATPPVGSRSEWLIRGIPFQAAGVAMTTLVPEPTSGHTIQVTSTIATGPVGTKYLIRGVKFPYFCNRFWTDKGAGAAGARILGNSRKHISGTWDGTGSITQPSYVYVGGSQFIVVGLRTRETGRPSHLTHGRRNPVV